MNAPKPQTTKLVTGHVLANEGAAFEYVPGEGLRRSRYNSVAGVGCALCSCGARSDVLDSAGKRKRWHREHKAEVLAGGAA